MAHGGPHFYLSQEVRFIFSIKICYLPVRIRKSSLSLIFSLSFPDTFLLYIKCCVHVWKFYNEVKQVLYQYYAGMCMY